MNVAAPDLPMEISIQFESPLIIEETEDSFNLFYDFSRKRTRHSWTVWLTWPKGVSRRRGASILQLEPMPTAEPANALTGDVMQRICVQHFERLLRLAKSDRFWVEEWKHRGYLLSKYKTDAGTYRIDQTTQAVARLLSDRLQEFFWDQWMLARLRVVS
jgi:hypothetical protein